MHTDYKVKLEIFEGPLDLLLYLIKRDEVDIYDISIERITKQYLEYLQAFKELNIDVAGEFVVMAANLLYLKSRSLLPVDQQMPDEEAEDDDPRWDLIRQLIEYKKFKEAAGQLHDRALAQEKLFARGVGGAPENLAPLRLGEVGIFQLINAFQNVIKRLEARENLQEIFGENFTVSDKIESILTRMSEGRSIRFSELFAQMASRVEVVVTFLALLELIRLRQVRALQGSAFGEIEIAPVSMRAVLIAGCGYVGAAAAKLLAGAGWSVTGWTRTEASARALATSAIAALPVNLADLDDVRRRQIAADVVVHCASSSGGGEQAYRDVYLAGAQNLARMFPAARLIFVSSTSVYAQDDGSEVTEESAADPMTATGKILREAEDAILTAGGSVLRVAGIYGPGRSFLLRSLLEGKAALAPKDRLVNQVHRDDIARAILLLAEREKITPPRIYNVVDDRPSPRNEVLRWLSEATGWPLAERPADAGPRKRGDSNKRVSNAKLRGLGWKPEYPGYIEAFSRSILPEFPSAAA